MCIEYHSAQGVDERMINVHYYYSKLQDPDRRKISGLSISFRTEDYLVYVCLRSTVNYGMVCRFVEDEQTHITGCPCP